MPFAKEREILYSGKRIKIIHVQFSNTLTMYRGSHIARYNNEKG